MADIILLIAPQTIKDRSGLHTNVDDKLIRPEIEAAHGIFNIPLRKKFALYPIKEIVNHLVIIGIGFKPCYDLV